MSVIQDLVAVFGHKLSGAIETGMICWTAYVFDVVRTGCG